MESVSPMGYAQYCSKEKAVVAGRQTKARKVQVSHALIRKELVVITARCTKKSKSKDITIKVKIDREKYDKAGASKDQDRRRYEVAFSTSQPALISLKSGAFIQVGDVVVMKE